MAATPQFKVYDHENQYLASFKHPEDAAILVAAKLDGTTIRLGHRKRDILWTEGEDGAAGQSYSNVAQVVHRRSAHNRPTS